MPKIERIFAFIAEEYGPEDEGICAVKVGNTWMPLVASDGARVESLRSLAQDLANQAGKRIQLVCFDQKTAIEEICPNVN